MPRPSQTRRQHPRRTSPRRPPGRLAVLTALVCVLVHAVLPFIHRPHTPLVASASFSAAAGAGTADAAQTCAKSLATSEPAHDCAACPACRMIGGGPAFLATLSAATILPHTCPVAAWMAPQRTVILTVPASSAPRGPPVRC